MTQSLRKKLETFQLRGLRQILTLPTTFIDRRWTNSRAYELASQTAYPQNLNQKVRPVTEELDERRVRLAGHMLWAPNDDPLRQVTYQPDSAPGPSLLENVELVNRYKIGFTDRMKIYIADSATLNVIETLPKMLPF